MTRRKRASKTPELTWEELEALLRKGAKSANELDKKLRRQFRLTPEQLRRPLD